MTPLERRRTTRSNMAGKPKTVTVGVLALQGAFKEHTQLLERASQQVAAKRKSQHRLDVDWRFIEVRTETDLRSCDALVVPGGESTTMSLVAARNGLLELLRDFVKVQRRPVWGTCAGLILLAESANRTKKGGQDLIGGLDVRVRRNYFGRQVESFVTELDLPFLNEADDAADNPPSPSSFRGVFIRAPVVETVLSSKAARTGRVPDGQGDDLEVQAPSKQPKDELASELADMEVQVMATLPGRKDHGGAHVTEAGQEDIIAVRQGNVFGTSFHPELSGDPRIHTWWLQGALDLIEKQHPRQ